MFLNFLTSRSSSAATIKIVLDLAKVDIDEFLAKGSTVEGRTVRSFDKRAASSYLSKQFRGLWTQKKVNFHIEIDGPTFNIFAEDAVDAGALAPAVQRLPPPMYAAFAVGQGWDSGVLLDTDPEGQKAKKKIKEMVLSKRFSAPTLMLARGMSQASR